MAANEPGQPSPEPGLTSRDLPTPASALAIGAHPDDVEFGCGATLAKWASQGCVVHHLVLTDGSKGTWDPDADSALLATTRQAEQREAARRLAGPQAGEVVFLGQVDGELDSTLALRGEVARVIRQLRPEVVLGHDPWKRYRLHPDHRHAGLLACRREGRSLIYAASFDTMTGLIDYLTRHCCAGDPAACGIAPPTAATRKETA